ncbi:MBG domain-containing protein [Geomonas subterranea]|uniref:MBG domain-containing protein n=1 Tax=Geomonas subterranea TaxID=2847989 RepID=UPI001CD51ED4|nr:MBG domain-containing protein [Geomonas fuzhouensis]
MASSTPVTARIASLAAAALTVALLLLAPPRPARGEVWTLDGFNIGGAGTVVITGEVRAIAQQRQDGKIVIAGDFTLTGGVPLTTRGNLARLNPDGTLDQGFAPPPLDGPVNALLLQPNPAGPGTPDLVIVGGGFTKAGATGRKGLARLSGGDGSLDGFDPVSSAFAVTVNAMALLPGGESILVGGEFRELKGGVPARNLGGLSVAGATSGQVNWSYQGGLAQDAGNVAVHAIQLQQRAVVVGGEFTTPFSDNVARFSAAGLYDGSFRPVSPAGAVRALALQEDGKILIGGEFAGGALPDYLARLNPDGTPDPFDPGLDLVAGSRVSSISVQPDGRILAAGRFTVGALPVKRSNMARFKIGGTLDDVVFPPTDAAIRVLARQWDGKILAGGAFGFAGGTVRTSLARFYPHGTLDADLPQLVDDSGMVLRASLHADGHVTVSGMFQQVLGQGRLHFARFTGNWTLDPDFSPLAVPQRVYSILPVPGEGMILGGSFLSINGAPQRLLVRVDEGGVPAPPLFNATVNSYLGIETVTATIPVPDGSFPEDGMTYVGGDTGIVSEYQYLFRMKKDGTRDGSFVPAAELDGFVTAMALQPDGKLLVGTDTGRILRLLPTGSLDPDWNGGVPLQMELAVHGMALLPDGRVLVSGDLGYPWPTTNPDTGLPELLWRNLLRLESDGSIDDSFIIHARYTYDEGYGHDVLGFALQSDGTILIFGIFDRVRDGFGTVLNRQYVARILPDGHLDAGFDLGVFPFDNETPARQVNSINLQGDGKFLLAGDFINVNGKSKLGRYANGWSFEELSVSAAGDAVTWLRSGSSPELWGVSFEYCDDLDAPVPNWVRLGYPLRIPGGWRLEGVTPAQLGGMSRNRYLRARGYAAADQGGTGSLVESVRLYHLKPQKTTVTVTALPQRKVYGQPDPELTYSFAPALNGADSFSGALSRVAGRDVGSYAIMQGTLALGPGYDLVFAGATLTIEQAPLTVTADDQTKTASFANPPLTASFTGLAPWDTPASLGGAPELSTAVDAATPRGSYLIHAAQGSITSTNYRYSFADGTMVVQGRPQAIALQAPPLKCYGDADFPAGASADSGLAVSYASSKPAVATVAGGEVRIAGAGETSLTATQGGDGIWDPAPPVTVPLTVLKAPLMVVADDKTRAYLTPNPQLTAHYLGFVKGEGVSVLSGAPSLITGATPESPVGSYPIIAGTGTLQAENYSFTPLQGTLTVYKSCQEITFPAIPERTYGDPPFGIVASACSGLPLNFRSSNPDVARVDGDVITITGAGTAVITASQAGTGDLETAPEKSQPFVVHRSGQQVSFSSPAQKVVGDPPFDLEGSATSGLPVSYSSSDAAVATVAGSTVTVVGAGTTVISAQQGGNGNYLPALPVPRTLVVSQEGTPPQLHLSTLNSGASTSNPVMNLMGGAQDASGIAGLTVAGSDRSADAPLFSSAVVLAEGENSIGVTARDGAGNVTTHTFSITLDALAPALAVMAPADNSVAGAAGCAVTGTVTPGATVTMAVNGAALRQLQVDAGAFTASALLAEGVNTIELNAELEGRSSRVKRSVTFTPGAPALAVTEPVQDLRTEAESVTIRGTAGSEARGGVQVEAGGAVFTPGVDAGTFQQQVALALGENRITVRAVSGGGAASVAHRNLVRIERISGDLDGNGSVDIQDAMLLLRISLGADPASAAALAHGDLAPLVNGVPRPDGVIDVGDLLVLLRRIVGLVHL